MKASIPSRCKYFRSLLSFSEAPFCVICTFDAGVDDEDVVVTTCSNVERSEVNFTALRKEKALLASIVTNTKEINMRSHPVLIENSANVSVVTWL